MLYTKRITAVYISTPSREDCVAKEMIVKSKLYPDNVTQQQLIIYFLKCGAKAINRGRLCRVESEEQVRGSIK